MTIIDAAIVGLITQTRRLRLLNLFLFLDFNLSYCLECIAPLGMENHKIAPEQISASSQWPDVYHTPNQGRLHYKGGGLYSGAWVAGTNNPSQWLQIDLRVQTNITFVATQGRHQPFQRVTKYKLQYSKDGISFQGHKQYGENSDKVRGVNILHGQNNSRIFDRLGKLPLSNSEWHLTGD